MLMQQSCQMAGTAALTEDVKVLFVTQMSDWAPWLKRSLARRPVDTEVQVYLSPHAASK